MTDAPGTSRILTLVFTDLADSTALKTQRGDQAVGELITRHRAHVRRLAAESSGRIIDWAGDGCFLTFETPSAAVLFALRLQQAHGEEPDLPGVRTGIHMGEVSERPGPDGDVAHPRVEGLAVDLAARISGLARPAQVLMSSSVADSARQRLDSDALGRPILWRAHGGYDLKGFDEALQIREAGLEGVAPFAAPAASEKATPTRPPGRTATGRRTLWVGVIATAVAVASVVLVWWTTLRGPHPLAALPGRAFLAVLPFANLSGDQTQEYFSDGITEDIIAALGRFPDLSVVGHEAVRRYKTKAPPPGELNRDLGVRYILEGTVRRDGDRVRVTAQLIDAPNGRHLWSDQYDGELKDLFTVQDEITRSVVGALAIKLIGLETERSFAKPTDNLEAYECVLRGREYLAAGTDQATSEARSLFDRAIRLDPAYASAYAALGWTWLLAAEAGWTEFRVDALQKAERLAAKAIGLDYGNAEAHALLGRVYLNRGQYAVASNEQARALALNPSDAATYAAQGVLLLFTGHPKEAIDPFETAMRLNPSGSRDKFFKAGAGWAYYLVQRYDDAVRVLERDATNSPDDYYVYAGLAAAYAELGRHADASRAAAAVLKAWPFFEVDTFVVQFAGGENQARIVDGLRKAGLK